MRDIVEELRADFGTKTLGQLAREREAAAQEIERLRDLASLQQNRTRGSAPSRRLPLEEKALLRITELCSILGLSRSTIYARIQYEQFPRPVRISERSVRWRAEDLVTWLNGR